jgi:hypothetical protein
LKQCFFIFLLSICLVTKATNNDELLFRLTINEKYRFSFNYSDLAGNNNLLVSEIAKINYLNLYRTGYDFYYELEIDIAAIDGEGILITSNLLPSGLSGDIIYKGFDLSDALTPDVYGFSLSVFNDDQLLLVVELANLPVGEPATTNLRPAIAFDPENVRFDLTDVTFLHSDEKTQAFHQNIAAINDFLALLELTEFSVAKALKIDPETETGLLVTHLAIYDLERFQDALQQKRFEPLQGTPIEVSTSFKDATTQLNSHLRRLRTIFSRSAASQKNIFDEMTCLDASQKLIETQTGYMEAMKRASHFHEPVYMRFANFLTEPADWEDLLANASSAFSEIVPNVFRRNFGEQLWRAYLKSASDFMEEEKYNEAQLLLSNAEVICTAEPDIDCGLHVFHNMAKARFGIYDAYLRIAESAMTGGNLELAKHYLNTARDYQSKNSGLIIIPAAVNRLTESLAWRYFESGKKAAKEENTERARERLVTAGELYRQIMIYDFDDAIERELEKIRRIEAESLLISDPQD